MTDEPKTTPKLTTLTVTGGPELLAHQIYDQALPQAGGDEREASLIVMHFLTEALVYSAGMSVGGDEVVLKGVLEQLAAMIAKAPVHPIVVAVAHNRKREP